ncbi:MAG TPA: tetratricopeptide repeat protein [Candidatus Binataceae bacterium]|nr:tetratricopeptide repeat protein [Candidatus Binataceae bacterium]
MKIFLSYGHDYNAPLAERIRSDLEAAGHQVWIDASEIKSGDDWRRSIVDGLSDTDWTLGFLSKHSTRDPGVCLDELAIALHVKAGTIATVLVEAETEVKPPVSLSHIQWLDMHDWKERERGGEEAWEKWYRGKLGEILSLLAKPDTYRFAGEIEELERRLRPVSQTADIGVLVDGFVGREWLLAQLEEWRKQARDSRLFWISAAPGMGKSAFAAWLAHHGKVNVIGLNLCRFNVDERRDPARVMCTLAFQIATRLPDYRRLLLDRFQKHDPKGTEVLRKSPAALFDWLLAEPLRFCIDGGRREDRYLVVIDGLDETIHEGRSELAEILAESAPKLPAWTAMVVTSRPEAPIMRQFAALQARTIAAESNENRNDLGACARGWLHAQGWSPKEADAVVERIVAASGGNFLYLRKLRDAVTEGLMDLAAPEDLPQGLVGLYERWFRRQFHDTPAYEKYRALIEVLVAAEHPVPVEWLTRLFGWSKPGQARMLEGLGSMFERRTEGVVPFHKSLRDWLTDAAGANFLIDKAAGARRLADALWTAFVQGLQAAGGRPLDTFLVPELPVQIKAFDTEMLHVHLTAAGAWPSVHSGLTAVATSLEARYEWQAALGWWQMVGLFAKVTGDDIARGDAFFSVGSILETVGRTEEAHSAYRDSLAIGERLAEGDPDNASWQRNLAFSYNKVGNVLVAQGKLAEADAAYRDSLAVHQRLAKADPGNAGWQRNLAFSYNKVGNVLVAQGKLAEADAAYRDSLAISEHQAKADPGNGGWQRDLAFSYNKVGNVLVAQGKLAEADAAYRDSLAVRERLAKADPGNAGWQRNLAVSYNKVGDVLVAQGKLAEALKTYCDSLAIAERLAKADPDNAGWRDDLSVSYEKVGDVLFAQGNVAEADTAYRASLAVRERLAKADPGNAGCQRDLGFSYNKVGNVLVAQGKLAEADAAYRDSLAVRARLAKADPGNAGWQQNLAFSYNKVGNVLVAQGKLAEADAAYRDSLAISEHLAKADSGNAGWQRDLAFSYNKVGNVLVAQGRLAAADAAYRDSLAIRERLAKADPGNAGWQRNLAVSYNKVGDVLVAQGKLAEALKTYRDSLAIAERLAKADPDNAGWRDDLSVSYGKVRDVLEKLGVTPSIP